MSITSTFHFSYPAQETQPEFSLSCLYEDKAKLFNESLNPLLHHIIWIKRGKGSYNIDFNTFEASDNTLFFLSRGQVFSLLTEELFIACRLSFTEGFPNLEEQEMDMSSNSILFNPIYGIPFLQLSALQSKYFEQQISRIEQEFRKPGIGHRDVLSSHLKLFLVEASRIKKNEAIDALESASTFALKVKFSELVEMHFREMHTVSDYAKLIGISPKSIAKRFQLMNVDRPSNIIKNRLILEAKKMLMYTSKSVKDISFELGFDDPGYFSRFFKKATKQSPMQYRNQQSDSISLHMGTVV